MRPRMSEKMRIWKPFAAERGEGDAGVIGRDAGRDGDGAEMGDGVLVGAVVVHLPDLLGAAG